jgi:tetratricopeptide (TPR) repeat protein
MKSSNWIGWALAGCLMLGGTARAGVDEEFAFASGLVSYSPSFPDFAQKVVDAVLAKDPAQKDRSKVVQAEILIQRRQFADAEAIVGELGLTNPKAQANTLGLAFNYCPGGNDTKPRQLYDAFYKLTDRAKPTDPDVLLRYREAAFKYAQILMMAGDYPGAAAGFERVEAVAENNEQKRSLQVSRAQALVKAAEQKSGDEKNKLLDDAKKVCETLQWGGLDLQFVDSIVIMANIELAKGNPAGARKVLMDYMDVIKPIDDTLEQLGLPMRESPMAGARSLLGRLMKEEADKLDADKKTDEAIKAYQRAFCRSTTSVVKYGVSDWGPQRSAWPAKESRASRNPVRQDGQDRPARDAGEHGRGHGIHAGRQSLPPEEIRRSHGGIPARAGAVPRSRRTFRRRAGQSGPVLHEPQRCALRQGRGQTHRRTVRRQATFPKGADFRWRSYTTRAGNADMAKFMFDPIWPIARRIRARGQILFYLRESRDGRAAGRANAYLAKIITDYQNDQNYHQGLTSAPGRPTATRTTRAPSTA